MGSTRINDLREEWGLEPRLSRLNEERRRPATPYWWFCVAHQTAYLAGEQSCGCHLSFQRPARAEEVPKAAPAPKSAYIIPPEELGAIGTTIMPAIVKQMTATSELAPPRDSCGRFTAGDQPPTDPALLSDDVIRAQLRRLYYSSPKGCRAILARLMGYRGPNARRTLRGVARGTAALLNAQRRHISLVLRAINREELVLEKAGLVRPDGRPVYLWRWRGQPKDAHWIPLPTYRRPGRPRKDAAEGP